MYLYDTHLSNKSINIHSIIKWAHTHPFILTCTKHKYNSNKFDPSSTVTAPCALVVCLSPSRFHQYETLFRHAKFPVAGSSLRLSVRHGLFSSNRSPNGKPTCTFLSNMNGHTALHAHFATPVSPNKDRQRPLLYIHLSLTPSPNPVRQEHPRPLPSDTPPSPGSATII